MLLPMMGLFLTLGKMMPPFRLVARVAAPVPALAGVTGGPALELLAVLGLRAIQSLVTVDARSKPRTSSHQRIKLHK